MEPIKGLKQIWQKIKEKRKTIYFEDMGEAWLAFKKKSVKESTYYNYIYKIENYLNPIFKGRKIKDFEGYDFEEVVKKFSKKLSNKTLKDIINILKAILKYSEKQYSRKLNVEGCSQNK